MIYLQKKSKEIQQSGWTVRYMLIILMGSLTWPLSVAAKEAGQADLLDGDQDRSAVRLSMAQQELQILRQELAEVLAHSEQQQTKIRRLQLSAAEALAGKPDRPDAAREAELFAALNDVSSAGQDLAARVLECCRFFDAALEEEELSAADRARIRYRLKDLRSAAERFDSQAKPGIESSLPESCRILAVDDRLQVAIIAAGALQGIRCGLVLQTEAGNKIKMRVVAIRPHVSAVLLMEGNLADLAPGMELAIGERSQAK